MEQVRIAAHHPLGLWMLGVVVGGVGTLVGAGGGFLLVPLLLVLFPELSPGQVTAVSLAVVALNSTSGSVAYARLGRVDFRTGWRLSMAMVPGMVGGVMAVAGVPKEAFSRLFGLLLFILAAYLLVRPGGERSLQVRDGAEAKVSARAPANLGVGMGLSAGIGFLAGLFGIGGGPLHVPLLIYVLRCPVPVATATSQFSLATTSWLAVLLHLTRGAYGAVGAILVSAGLGAVVGAQLGARVSQFVRDAVVVRALGVVLALVGLRLVA